MNDSMLAICILIGQEDVHFIWYALDEVEWTDPKYYHQN